MPDSREIVPFVYENGRLRLLDQRALPTREIWLTLDSLEAAADAIASMAVRGAPAIGCVAAWGMLFAARTILGRNLPPDAARKELHNGADLLIATRPTAVNLAWAVNRQLRVAANLPQEQWPEALEREAARIAAEDRAACEAMGRHGLETLPSGALCVLTHCNAGALATAGYGTALGIVRSLWHAGRLKRVYADDTRPRQQGARLTAWELHREGLPVTLVADTVAGMLMAQGRVDAVVVGADRIAANGDFANKIGTYSLAVLAAHHGIPFFVAAPTSTLDPACPTGADILIEERDPDEVRRIDSVWVTAPDVDAYNPAFDVTPGSLVTAIITERGVARPSFRESLAAMNPVH